MKNKYFITNEPNELVASLLTPLAKSYKLFDWKNGYGKYTLAIILLYAGYEVYDKGFPIITTDNWLRSLFTYAHYVFLFSLAFHLYTSSFKKDENLLVINSKGILYNEEKIYWNDVLSFQLSLEKEMNTRNHAYYLHLKTKNRVYYKIDISLYNKKFNEIHNALIKNAGKNEVKDLGFTQMI